MNGVYQQSPMRLNHTIIDENGIIIEKEFEHQKQKFLIISRLLSLKELKTRRFQTIERQRINYLEMPKNQVSE